MPCRRRAHTDPELKGFPWGGRWENLRWAGWERVEGARCRCGGFSFLFLLARLDAASWKCPRGARVSCVSDEGQAKRVGFLSFSRASLAESARKR